MMMIMRIVIMMIIIIINAFVTVYFLIKIIANNVCMCYWANT